MPWRHRPAWATQNEGLITGSTFPYEIVRQGRRFIETGTVLDLQVKSTIRAERRTRSISYDLEVKAYEDLRQPEPNNLRILVLVVFAADPAVRLSQSEEKLTIRHCAYWLCLEGSGPTMCRKSVRVQVPRANLFSVAGLRELLERARIRRRP